MLHAHMHGGVCPRPSRVHVTGMPPHCCRRIAAHVRQPRSARLDLGYTARPHVSVLVVRVVDAGATTGFDLLCFVVPCGEDSVTEWTLVWLLVGTAS